jgi:hypothetical protein
MLNRQLDDCLFDGGTLADNNIKLQTYKPDEEPYMLLEEFSYLRSLVGLTETGRCDCFSCQFRSAILELTRNAVRALRMRCEMEQRLGLVVLRTEVARNIFEE